MSPIVKEANAPDALETLPMLSTSPENHPPVPQPVWYFAYGSNMASSTFMGMRKIKPLSHHRAIVPTHKLTFDIPGIPYKEPSFASIDDKGEGDMACIGVVYEITRGDYERVLATEGAGSSYAEIEVEAYKLVGDEEKAPADIVKDEKNFVKAMTLKAIRIRTPNPRPSVRYLNILRDGAAEHKLPKAYASWLASLPAYHPPTRPLRAVVGKYIFLTVWMPVVMVIFTLLRTTTGKNGKAPGWLRGLAERTFRTMWRWHDSHFWRSVFGRGDGLEEKQFDDEKVVLVM
ncbi:hypothetical protein YB2330_004608 [Saitoella coloradoensis]